MLSNWPFANTRRWAAFRRKGAEILTVLLVVVLSERMFYAPLRPSSSSWAVSPFVVPGLSPRRVLAVVRESKTGAAQGKPWDSARFLCEEIFSCGIGSGQGLYRITASDHEQHGQVYRRMQRTDGK